MWTLTLVIYLTIHYLRITDQLEESSTFIPSESSIQVAREKRERLRKTQASGEDDFISLSVTRKVDEPQGPHPGSRLVREDDELGEGDDGMSLSLILADVSYFPFFRICGIYQCSRKDSAWKEITQS